MPTPSYRVPVRVARGTKAALDAGLADLQEGELCYATDENALYVIEGGVLTPASADPTNIEIVNDTTPQLGGNLDTNSFQIVSTAAGNIQIAPDTTGVLEVMGNTGNDAVIKLNCETNTHGIKLKSPPHSAAADYTLVFPNDTGSDGQALTTDGAGVMSWTTPSTVGSINDLTDVDTTTVAPTDGQALVWNNGDGEWVPGGVAADLSTTSIDALQDVDTATTPPTNDQVLAWNGTSWVPANQSGGGGGGAVDSVNGETGVVSLGIQDMNDYELNPAAVVSLLYSDWSDGGSFADPGSAGAYATGNIRFIGNYVDSNGVDAKAYFEDAISRAGGSSMPVWISPDGIAWTEKAAVNVSGSTNGATRFEITSSLTAIAPISGPIHVSFYDMNAAAGQPLAEGDILQWNSTDQKFKPAQLPAGGGGGAVDSVNGETGTVSLGIQDMDDFALNQILPSTVFLFDTVEQHTNPSADGQSRIFSSGTRLQMYATDANGEDYGSAQAAASLAHGGVFNVPIWTKCDDDPWVEHTASNIPSTTSNVFWSVDSLSPATSLFDGQNVTTLRVTFSAPVGAQDIPLAEGDILQWVSADQEFKPAQLPDPVVGSVNGEIGDVSLGIQDMDDFELAYPPGSATVFQYATIFDNSNPNSTGQVRIWFSGTRLQVNEYDSVGNPSFIDAAIAAKAVQPTSTPIWTKGDDNAWVEHVGNIGTDPGGDGGYISINDISPAIIGTESTLTSFSISFASPATTPLPLAEGDVLQWNNVAQKFKPTQLSNSSNPTPTLFDTWYQFDDGNITNTGAAVDVVGEFKMYSPGFAIDHMEIYDLSSSDNTGATSVDHPLGTLPDYSVLWFQAVDPSSGDLGPVRIATMKTISFVNGQNTQLAFHSQADIDQVYNDVASIGLGLRIGVYSSPFTTKAQLKDITAASVDFADFQSRIAAL